MLKYAVVQVYENLIHTEILFVFDTPELAVEVCRQLTDKNDYNTYTVIVTDA